MISKKEIIGLMALFAITYFIIRADHKLQKKCKCKDCYLSAGRVSIKIPLIVTLVGFVLYKLMNPYIKQYLCITSPVIKQNIIAEMADF